MFQNFPNPFNPETVISYQIPTNSFVALKVYDILGREIVTLVNEVQNAGVHRSTFSALHSTLTSGVYIYTINAKSITGGKEFHKSAKLVADEIKTRSKNQEIRSNLFKERGFFGKPLFFSGRALLLLCSIMADYLFLKFTSTNSVL